MGPKAYQVLGPLALPPHEPMGPWTSWVGTDIFIHGVSLIRSAQYGCIAEGSGSLPPFVPPTAKTVAAVKPPTPTVVPYGGLKLKGPALGWTIPAY